MGRLADINWELFLCMKDMFVGVNLVLYVR